MNPKTIKVPTKGDSDFYFIFSFNFIFPKNIHLLFLSRDIRFQHLNYYRNNRNVINLKLPLMTVSCERTWSGLKAKEKRTWNGPMKLHEFLQITSSSSFWCKDTQKFLFMQTKMQKNQVYIYIFSTPLFMECQSEKNP